MIVTAEAAGWSATVSHVGSWYVPVVPISDQTGPLLKLEPPHAGRDQCTGPSLSVRLSDSTLPWTRDT